AWMASPLTVGSWPVSLRLQPDSSASASSTTPAQPASPETILPFAWRIRPSVVAESIGSETRRRVAPNLRSEERPHPNPPPRAGEGAVSRERLQALCVGAQVRDRVSVAGLLGRVAVVERRVHALDRLQALAPAPPEQGHPPGV